MTRKARTIKRVWVQYQPNLQYPVKPIPLGVIAEEFDGDNGYLAIVGRAPVRSSALLNLDDLWGPFRSTVTDWIQLVNKNVDELIAERSADSSKTILELLVERWNQNLCMSEPEEVAVKSLNSPLQDYATRWFEQFVGEPFEKARRARPAAKAKRKAAAAAYKPWTKRLGVQELHASQ